MYSHYLPFPTFPARKQAPTWQGVCFSVQYCSLTLSRTFISVDYVSLRDKGNAASLWQCWDVNPALSGSEDLG